MITKDQLSAVVRLDTVDWCLYWVEKTPDVIPCDKVRTLINRRFAGKKAGYPHKGYLRLRCFGKHILAHRAIWCLYYGEMPSDDLEIDHMDGNRMNNCIDNLRLVDPSVNARNRLIVRHDNETKLLGVGKANSKFRARVRTPNGRIHLGVFDTAEEAHNAYVIARRKMEYSTL